MDTVHRFHLAKIFIALALTSAIAFVLGCSKSTKPENHAPVITSVIANPTSVSPGGTSTITVVASDPDGDQLTYTYSVAFGAIVPAGTTATWTLPQTAGAYTVMVNVSDGRVMAQGTAGVIVTSPSVRKNVALQSNGGTATAISVGTYLGMTQYAYYANDGISSTGWSDNWDMPAWLRIEFDQTYAIDSVGVWWASHQHTFSIRMSADGNSWTTVVPSRLSNNSEGSQPVHQSFAISSINAKYIEIDITTTSAPSSHIFQASVCELEAYGH